MPALIARDRELAVVGAFVTAAAAHGGCLAVHGEAGLGKSALAAEAERLARAAGTRVLRWTGAGGEPGAGLRELFGAGPVNGFGVRDQLARLSATRPVLVIIDEAGRLDEPSATALAFAARRLTGTRAGLLITSRLPLGWRPDAELRLEPLTDAAAAELLRDAELGPRARQRILAEARGNPEALLRLPRLLTPAQRDGSAPLPAHLPLDPHLHHVFGARVTQLPAATQRLLLLIALEPDSRLSVLESALGGDPLADLAAAERAGLVHLADGRMRVAFTHPLIPAAVIAGSDAAARRAAHLLLARVLGGVPDRRVWHLADACSGEDDELADDLERAGRRALRRGDALSCVRALLRSAELAADNTARSRRLAEAAFLGAHLTGDLALSRAVLNRSEVDATGPDAAAAAALLALNEHGDLGRAYAALTDAIVSRATDSGPASPEDGHSGPMDALAEVAFWAGHRAAPAPCVPDLDRRPENIAARLRFLTAEADRLYAAGAWDDADHRAAEAVRLGEEWGYRAPVWAARRVRGLIRAARDTGRGPTPAEPSNPVAAAQTREIAALAALGDDDPETAFRLLDGPRPASLGVSFDFVEAAVRTRRAPAAKAHLAAVPYAAPGGPEPLRLAGATALLTGTDRAFEYVLALGDAARFPFDAARIRLAYGEHLRRTGSPAHAREQFGEALETFQRLGAQPWARRAARELRAAGSAPPMAVCTAGAAVLTAQEEMIAQLAAKGLTNKQIGERMLLSHRTIGAHLYRVFPKLGVTSRAALRDALSTVAAGAA